MAVTAGYRSFVVEQLERTATITSKNMFGGVGIYAEGYFFALLAEDRLYFKVDESNRLDFEEAGMEPFRPYGDERAMKYYEVPVAVLEDADLLRNWSEKAIAVAVASKKPKKKPKKKA